MLCLHVWAPVQPDLHLVSWVRVEEHQCLGQQPLCLATLVVKVVPLYDSGQLLPSQCPHDLLDITRAGAGDWRMAVGDARPDELCECRSGESG